ncbi:MAG: class I SAM-dependent methyltransferase, partial [Paracoccaceae bacterium]
MLYWLRIPFFAIPSLRHMLEREPISPSENRVRWDDLLSNSRFETYLGNTIRVDATNAMTAIQIKYHSNENPAVLDVGCSGGTLPLSLYSFDKYMGTDVSAHATEVAKAEYPHRQDLESGRVRYQPNDLRTFDLGDETWDVIVFNEVLYYLKCEQAAEQVQRYAKNLKPGGIVCISMNDDGKSMAIFAEIRKK